MTLIKYDSAGELHITNITKAREMIDDNTQFDTIITVCQDSIQDYVDDKNKYCHYRMADGVHNKHTSASHKYNMFEDAADTLHQKLSNGEKVLIHCHAGQSRSVSVSVAALGRLLNKSGQDTLELIHNYRFSYQDPSKILMEHANKYIREHTGIEPAFDSYKDKN